MDKEYDKLSIKSKQILDEFEKQFARVKHKRIILYGIGKVSILLLKFLKAYNFVGVMDRDPENIGKDFFGQTIIDYEQAKKSADLIIIISSDTYWNIIFERISFLEYQHNIPIYFQNGVRAVESQTKSETSKIEYWKNNYEELKNEINNHEIISFDLFDTLIMRKISMPQDVFKLVEQTIKSKYHININFVDLRNEAESLLYENKIVNFNLDDIYNVIKNISILNIEQLDLIKKIECEIEKKLIVRRDKMVELLDYAVAQKKQVYLLSDMYLPKKLIETILQENNIKGYNEFYLSNALNMNKHDMSLWKYYKNNVVKSKSSLHIGDNYNDDIKNPKKVGIDSFQILSSYEVLRNSSINQIIPYIKTVNDSLIVGIILAQIFNDPFKLNINNGNVVFDNLEEFGYVFFGALIFYYIIWILKENMKINSEAILFFARDGYLLKQIYDEIIGLLNIKNAPKSIYFKTSRRMCVVASIKNVKDIYEVAKIPYSGRLDQYIKYRFGINNIEEWGIDVKQYINVDTDYAYICSILSKHKDEILKNSYIERRNYVKYMKNIGVYSKNNISVVDPRLNGTIQYYLKKITNKKYTGFYCNAILGKENIYGIGNEIHALYQNINDLKGDNSNIKKYSLLLEGVLVAPEGMYIKCNENGEFENLEKAMNQIIFDKKKVIHEGIKKFIRDILASGISLKGLKINSSAKFVDDIFGILCSNSVKLTDEIKETFYIDDVFEVNSDRKIFE